MASTSAFRSLSRLLAAILLWLAPIAASAEVRALVVASDYAAATDPDLHLDNPVVDGRQIAGALRRAGVSDLTLVEDPLPAAWASALDAFVGRLGPRDIAFVYYAGHGLQIGGINYFLAADGTTLLGVDAIVQRVTAKAQASVFVIDACRNNPFSADDAVPALAVVTRSATALSSVSIDEVASGGRGLAQLGELRGLSAIVLFSTEPGNVALDGAPGEGSPFAHVAAVELARRQSLDAAFRRIATGVNRATGGRQSPWRQGDLAFDVYLAGMSRFPVP